MRAIRYQKPETIERAEALVDIEIPALVDERNVGKRPNTLDWAAAAALPLTPITALEALFDRLDVKRPASGTIPAIPIVGGAGGVGSIAIQIVRALTDLTIIATAPGQRSRLGCGRWARTMPSDHSKLLAQQIAALGGGALLAESRLVDDGKLRTTMTERYSPIYAANLKRVHALIESGKVRGKLVLEGFDLRTQG